MSIFKIQNEKCFKLNVVGLKGPKSLYEYLQTPQVYLIYACKFPQLRTLAYSKRIRHLLRYGYVQVSSVVAILH